MDDSKKKRKGRPKKEVRHSVHCRGESSKSKPGEEQKSGLKQPRKVKENTLWISLISEEASMSVTDSQIQHCN